MSPRRNEPECGAASLIFFGTLALGVALVLVSPPVGARPSYAQCSSSSDCEEDECCVLGMNRYSVPECMPLRGEGETCRRESQTTHNVTVGYPNGESIDLVNIHYIMCGCYSGLYCKKESSSCAKIIRKPVG